MIAAAFQAVGGANATMAISRAAGGRDLLRGSGASGGVGLVIGPPRCCVPSERKWADRRAQRGRNQSSSIGPVTIAGPDGISVPSRSTAREARWLPGRRAGGTIAGAEKLLDGGALGPWFSGSKVGSDGQR